MITKLTLTTTAALALVFGLGYVLAPAQLIALFGVAADPLSQHLARNFGSALIAIATIAWTARNLANLAVLRGISLGFFIYFALGAISIALFALTGLPNNFVWFPIAFHILLAVMFGYLLIAKHD